ncbi:MAG: hypothetical protein R3F62_08140 [Planctomycetota bacterium]
MWLGPDSKVACAEAWTLDAGAVLQGRELPSLLVDGAEISPVGEAELRVEVARRTAEVDVYAGKVYIRDTRGDSSTWPQAAACACAAGAWATRARPSSPRACARPSRPRASAYGPRPGTPRRSRATACSWASSPPKACAGRRSRSRRSSARSASPDTKPAAYAPAPAGGRLYLRLVLEDRHPITLQLSSPDQSRSWRRTVEGHPGVNHVDLALDELPALGGGAAIQAGQLLDLLSVQAGGAGETIPLVLEYVQVYVP